MTVPAVIVPRLHTSWPVVVQGNAGSRPEKKDGVASGVASGTAENVTLLTLLGPMFRIVTK
jgi:hypothetical protein